MAQKQGLFALGAILLSSHCAIGQVPLPLNLNPNPTGAPNVGVPNFLPPMATNGNSPPPLPVQEPIPYANQPFLPAIPLKPPGAMQDGSKPWTLNFRDAPWSTVVRELAKSMGLSLSMSFEPSGTFTYFDDQRYSTSEVIDIINDHLIPLGAILIRNEQRLTMVSTQQPINDSIVPFISVAEIDLVGRNEIAGTAIPIKGVDPMQAVSEISLVKSPVGQVRSFANSQRIVIIDTGTHLRRIRDLLLQTGFARSDTISSVYISCDTLNPKMLPKPSTTFSVDKTVVPTRSNLATCRLERSGWLPRRLPTASSSEVPKRRSRSSCASFATWTVRRERCFSKP